MNINIEHIAKNAVNILLEDRAQPVGYKQLEKSIDNLLKKLYDKTKTTDEELKTKFWHASGQSLDINLTTEKDKIDIQSFNANLDMYMPHLLQKLGYYVSGGEDKEMHRTYQLEPYYPNTLTDLSKHRYLYHSTPKGNAAKIIRQGLIPLRASHHGYTPRIFVGTSPTHYGEVLFKIDVSKLRKGTKFYQYGAGYITYTHIPPEALTIIRGKEYVKENTMNNMTETMVSILLESVADDNINRAMKILDKARQDKTIAKKLADLDPTIDKGYLQWIVKVFLNGSMLYPGDADRAKEALDFFEKNKRKATWIYPKDILQYKTLQDLENVKDRLQGINLKQLRSQVDIVAGSESVYNDGVYQVIRVFTIPAIEYYSIDTRWCTKKERGKAVDYIPYTDMYVMLKSGFKLYLYSFGKSMWHTQGFEIKDVEDEEAWGKTSEKERSIILGLFKVYKENKFHDGLLDFVAKFRIDAGSDLIEKYEQRYFAAGIPTESPKVKLSKEGEAKLEKLNPAIFVHYQIKYGGNLFKEDDFIVHWIDSEHRFIEVTNAKKLIGILTFLHWYYDKGEEGLKRFNDNGKAYFFLRKDNAIEAAVRLVDSKIVNMDNKDIENENPDFYKKIVMVLDEKFETGDE